MILKPALQKHIKPVTKTADFSMPTEYSSCFFRILDFRNLFHKLSFTLSTKPNQIMKRIFIFLFVLTSYWSFAQIPDGYYSSAEGLQGDELKAALHNIIDNHTTKTYDDIRYILDETDKDPNNANNLILLYKGTSVSNVWDAGVTYNREHVWAKSHGDFGDDPPAGSDLHHIRPADPSVNSSRGNKDFDNGGTQHPEATECYSDADSWEPRDAVKGDVARMMFYMATRYEGDVYGEPDLELVDYTGTDGPIFGKLSTLLQWHEQDPVDDFERNRNEVIYSYQHNRNPFVDHPEYVDAIYNPQTTSLASNLNKNNIKIFPNPVVDILIIQAPEGFNTEVYSIIGELMVSTTTKKIDFSSFYHGVYFVVIKDETGQSIISKKIIKK